MNVSIEDTIKMFTKTTDKKKYHISEVKMMLEIRDILHKNKQKTSKMIISVLLAIITMLIGTVLFII